LKPKHIKAYMECSEAFSRCSCSERLQVGCVIVKNNNIISTGYNALPTGLDGSLEDTNGNTKPEVRHAEKNALMGLIKSNESAVGATMFCTHSCCYLCSVDIVDAGIVRFIYKDEYRDISGLEYLKARGVQVEKYEESS